ncbi:MAG: hypothetical protein ABIA47_02435 [bacterium]
MTITTHTAIGAVIGFSVGTPLLGFALGIASHLLVDMIPHGDAFISEQFRVHKKKKTAVRYGSIDSLIAMMLALFIFNLDHTTSTMAVSAAIAGSVLPDLLVGMFDVTKSKYLKKVNGLHWFFHDFFVTRYKDVKLRHGLILQVGIVVALVSSL